jgi:hypothetical protein
MFRNEFSKLKIQYIFFVFCAGKIKTISLSKKLQDISLISNMLKFNILNNIFHFINPIILFV